MSQAEGLAVRPDLGSYKKSAKKRLDELRAQNPEARLADAQLAVAREHGLPSWRKRKDRIDQLIGLLKLFDAIRKDDRGAIRALLKAKPGLSRLASPEGQTTVHVAAECNKPDAIEILSRTRRIRRLTLRSRHQDSLAEKLLFWVAIGIVRIGHPAPNRCACAR